MTQWLLNDKVQHASAIAGVLGDAAIRSGAHPVLDAATVESLDSGGLVFLCRRMLGFVHDRAQLTQLALSMLHTKADRPLVFGVLRAMLVDEIGYDYPASTIAEGKTATSSAPASSQDAVFLASVVEALEQTEQVLNALAPAAELRPPNRLRRLLALAKARSMGNALERAQEDSIWRQIATEIPVKAGRSTFSYRERESYGEPIHMQSHSHSIELPRREVFDPVGNAIRHFGFRRTRRGET